MVWIPGDVSASQTLSSLDHLYADHINQLRESNASATVGRTSNSQYYCDGVGDEVELQAANDSLSYSGGYIILKPGTYDLANPLALSSNVTLIGENRGSVILTTSMSQGSTHRGILSITNKQNISIENLTLNAGNTATALSSYGHDTLTLKNCNITGNTTTVFGIINLDGQFASSSMYNTLFIGCKFYDITAAGSTIGLYPRDGRIIEGTQVIACTFVNTYGPSVNLNTYDICRDTKVIGCRFIDLYGGSSSTTPAIAVLAGLANPNYVEGLTVTGNYYRQTRTSIEQQGFAWWYAARGVSITDNKAFGSWTPTQGTIGPALAPGRVADATVGSIVSGNYFEGFDAAWDPDTMTHMDCHDNEVYNCGRGFNLGYGVQKYVKIHHNIMYNSPMGSSSGSTLSDCGIAFMNSTPVKCEVNYNTIIDDRVSPVMANGIELTGDCDFSDVEVTGNKFYLPNGTFSNDVLKQFGGEVLPRVFENNEFHDSTGIRRDFIYSQGNITGATTVDVANAAKISATLIGNVTITLSTGSYRGQRLELSLTQDATGSRLITWPSNFKKAGGTLTLSTAGGAKDKVVMEYDGVNWNEISRLLNLS